MWIWYLISCVVLFFSVPDMYKYYIKKDEKPKIIESDDEPGSIYHGFNPDLISTWALFIGGISIILMILFEVELPTF